MEAVVIQFVLGLAAKYPVVTTVFLVIGVLRAIFKPFFAFLHVFVAATPSQKDDELLNKAEGSKVYKAFAFVVDYLASIKLPGYDK